MVTEPCLLATHDCARSGDALTVRLTVYPHCLILAGALAVNNRKWERRVGSCQAAQSTERRRLEAEQKKPSCQGGRRSQCRVQKKPVWSLGVRFSSWRRAPRRRLADSRSVSRRDLLSYLCRDGCALWPRNPWAGAPLLQHPPFPQVWCGPPNRTSCMPVAQTDGSMPMHECRPLSPPGCFRIRL
jgi:hypothetical protein